MAMIDGRVTADGLTRAPDWSLRALPRLESRVDRASPEFAANAAAMHEQAALLRERYALVDPWVVLRGRVVARDPASGMRIYRLGGGTARIAAL